jgi:hypothetical protein
MAPQAIADQLNNESVPPLRGSVWQASNVKAAVTSPRRTRSLRDELPRIPREEER